MIIVIGVSWAMFLIRVNERDKLKVKSHKSECQFEFQSNIVPSLRAE